MSIIATALTVCENTLWIGTGSGLYNLSLNQINQNSEVALTKIDINEQINVETLSTDRNNQIWLGVDLGGVRILNTKKTKFDCYRYSTSQGFNNRIRALHEDNNGNCSDIGTFHNNTYTNHRVVISSVTAPFICIS